MPSKSECNTCHGKHQPSSRRSLFIEWFMEQQINGNQIITKIIGARKKQTTPSPLLSGFSLSTIYNLKFVYIRLFRILRFCLANACFMASQYMFPHSFCFPRYTRVSHNLIQFSQYDRCCSPIYKINYNYIQLIVVT